MNEWMNKLILKMRALLKIFLKKKTKNYRGKIVNGCQGGTERDGEIEGLQLKVQGFFLRW